MSAVCCQFDTNRPGHARARAGIRGLALRVVAGLGVLALLAGAILIPPAAAQEGTRQETSREPQSGVPATGQQPQTAQPPPKWRLLTRAEGRSIISVAWQHDQPVASSQDCSHLVHEIYSAAGYAFPYATSFALYAGDVNFARVKHPQPGDVIAWPGHVGIVVNPATHSFFSLVRSGAEEEDYTSHYWRSRGQARFYRFLVPNSAYSAAKKVSASTRSAQKATGLSTKDAVDRRSDAAPPENKAAVTEASERPPVPLISDPADASLRRLESLSIPIAAAQRNPTREEIAEAITEWSKTSGEILRDNEPLKFSSPVVIFDQLSVDRLHIKGDRGLVELRVYSGVLLNGDGVDFKQRHEKMRWELQRTESGWVAIPPPERTYVSRDVAIRIFAAQLAQLTDSDSAAAHDEIVLGLEARLANLLSALLQNR